MAALDPRPLATLEPDHKYDDKSELWIDYVADTGDGWNATYSIAYLVGRDALYLRNDLEPTPQPIANSGTAEAAAPNDPGLTTLPGGTVLILGGDQVYPTASASAYQNRLQDPFRCARPGEGAPKRDVYAIPGNHDWYDGLTAFIRLFCQRSKRTTGTWLTQQRRSYFAIRIREGWWLWAADLALDDDLDPPQLDYFTDQSKLLKAGDRVILCLPAPTWVTAFDATAREQPEVSQQADKAFLIKKQVTDANARIVLALAGDLHHYARHEAADGVQFITCGGGGAYTLGTIRQPETIHCSNGTTAQLRRRFPSDAESRALRWWSLLFPVFSPGFTALLTVYQLLLLYFLHSVSRLTHLLNEDGPPAWLDHLANTPLSWHALPGLLLYAMQITLADSMTFLYAFALVGGCIAFARLGRADPKRKADWIAAGTCHGLLQLLLGLRLLLVRGAADAGFGHRQCRPCRRLHRAGGHARLYRRWLAVWSLFAGHQSHFGPARTGGVLLPVDRTIQMLPAHSHREGPRNGLSDRAAASRRPLEAGAGRQGEIDRDLAGSQR